MSKPSKSPWRQPKNWCSNRGAALAQGQRRYFSGEPCLHGHVGQRYASTGNCVACLQERRRLRDPAWDPATTPQGRVGA